MLTVRVWLRINVGGLLLKLFNILPMFLSFSVALGAGDAFVELADTVLAFKLMFWVCFDSASNIGSR